MAGPELVAATVPVMTKMPAPMMTPTPKTIRSRAPEVLLQLVLRLVGLGDGLLDGLGAEQAHAQQPNPSGTRSATHPPASRARTSASDQLRPASRASSLGARAGASAAPRRDRLGSPHRLRAGTTASVLAVGLGEVLAGPPGDPVVPASASAPLKSSSAGSSVEPASAAASAARGQPPVLGRERAHGDVLGDALAEPRRYAVGAGAEGDVGELVADQPGAGRRRVASSIRGLSRKRVSARSPSSPSARPGPGTRRASRASGSSPGHVLEAGQEGRVGERVDDDPAVPVVGHLRRDVGDARLDGGDDVARRAARCRRSKMPEHAAAVDAPTTGTAVPRLGPHARCAAPTSRSRSPTTSR